MFAKIATLINKPMLCLTLIWRNVLHELWSRPKIQYVSKKEQNVFHNIFYKTQAILIKVISFLNNFAKNHVNVFHLTWIMSLHYLVKLKMLITDLDKTATENGVGQAGSCRHCGSHSSVASSIDPDQLCVSCTPSFAIFLHAVMNWIQI